MDLGDGITVLETDGVMFIQTRPVAESWDSVSIRLQGRGHSAFRCAIAKLLLVMGVKLLGYDPMIKVTRK